MPNSTVYDVQIRYGLDDKASAALENLGRTAERTEKHVGGLKEGLQTLAEVFLVREGLHKAKEWFVDANAEMENMKIQMGAISSYNLSKPFEEAAKQTDTLIEGWQTFSKSTTLTTKDLVHFGSMLEGSVLTSGASMKDFDAIVRRGAVVGNVLGAGHAGGLKYVATEFSEALQGNLRKTEMLNMQLLKPAMEKEGKSIEEWNHLTTQERVRIFMKAINDPAWDAAINKQRTSYLGVTSTLKDNFEILARETGVKFFEKIKGSVGEINDFIDKHPKEIAEFTTKVSDGLVKAFDFIKKAFEFVVQHKDIILKIAETWAIGKVTGAFGGMNGALGMLNGGQTGGGASGLAGLLQNLGVGGASTWRGSTSALMGQQMNAFARNGFNMAGMTKGVLVGAALDELTGNLGKTNTAMMSFEGALAALPGPLGALGTVALALHSALKFVAEAIDERHQERLAKSTDFGVLRSTLLKTKGEDGKYHDHTDRSSALRYAKELGLFDSKTGNFDMVKARSTFEGIAAGSEDAQKALKVVPDMVRSLAALFDTLSDDERKKFLGGGEKPTDVDAGKKKDANKVNVTIQKIEVPASDPDRFVHQLVKKFDKISKNPTQAERALRGGF